MFHDADDGDAAVAWRTRAHEEVFWPMGVTSGIRKKRPRPNSRGAGVARRPHVVMVVEQHDDAIMMSP